VPKGAPPEARTLAKRVGETLAAERRRVEALLPADREWSTVDWVRRYLAHPVTGSIGRRLIWLVSADGQTWTTGTPEWRADRWVLVNSVGADVDLAMEGGRIRLWHPVCADAEGAAAWRDMVTRSRWRQPFKQAFREVYRPTVAEEVGKGGSNRFAGHILRYRQANALMRARGWHAGFLGPWGGGGHGEATKSIGAWRVSFGHDLIGEIDPLGNEAQYCSTDRVRFDRLDGATVRLADVPVTLFSEAMRDVDLFVGVTSIATDPAWALQTGDRFSEYWEATSFGELTPSAEIRRDVVARSLPALGIAAQCELTERHLRIRGTRRVYKIHLGSGHVLMEPDDAYLHIVAKPEQQARFPYDDDPTLAVILRKAVMLAADDKITDAAFLDQL
jgi:hypothetical protein